MRAFVAHDASGKILGVMVPHHDRPCGLRADQAHGIAVVDLPSKISRDNLHERVSDLIAAAHIQPATADGPARLVKSSRSRAKGAAVNG